MYGKEAVHEVARCDKYHLTKTADSKAQISKVFVSLKGLIGALRLADFLTWWLSSRATSRTIYFSISNSYGNNAALSKTQSAHMITATKLNNCTTQTYIQNRCNAAIFGFIKNTGV